jgi:hypothetical protein
MDITPDTTNNEETKTEQVDIYWLVANIFSIIHLLEDKFGPQAVEQIVAVATTIEESMRKEQEEAK